MLFQRYYVFILLCIIYCSCCSSFKLPIYHPLVRWRRPSLSATYAFPPPKAELTDEKKLFFSQKTFESMGLSSAMIQCVDTLGFTKPSKIQALSYYGINTGKPCIIADQTGSGKTLAYLLPTLQRMLEKRKAEKLGTKRVSPYIVVMTPTAELANQVSRVVKTLANGLKFRTACFTSLCDLDGEKKKLRLGADVVISTPGRLLQLLKNDEINLSDLRVMVLDEADVLLLDESFPLQPIGQACKHLTDVSSSNPVGDELVSSDTGVGRKTDLRSSPDAGVNSTRHNKPSQSTRNTNGQSVTASTILKTQIITTTITPTASSTSIIPNELSPTQFLFVTATLPDVVVSQIVSEFPDVMTLKGPGLHRIASSVEEILVDCSGGPNQPRSMEQVMNNKKNALLEALNKCTSERTIVFCNTIDQCRRVENILQRDDRNGDIRTVLSYHGALEGSTRDNNLKEFSRQLLQHPVVLISTDRASRGLDFNQAQVDHVILYDFPKEPSEYLRRVGRTGRAGRAGRATVLVFGKQVPAARAVRKAGMEGKRIQPSDNL